MDEKMKEYQIKLKENIKILIENEMLNEAKEALEQYKEIVKDDIEVFSIKGVIEIMEGNFDNAEKILKNGCIIAPNNFDILYNLAYLYEMNKKYIYSYIYYKKALKCDFNNLIKEQVKNKLIELENNEKVKAYKQRKKVLIFAYYFPPLSGSGVQRTLKFVKYLRDFGWEPVVVTVDESNFPLKDETLINEIPEEIEIIKIKEKIALDTKQFEKLINLYKIIVNDNKIIDEFVNEVNKTGKYIFVPDQNIFWSLNVIDSINKYIDLSDIDILYTTSGPYSAHFIGYYLKLHYQKPWIADFRDEWTKSPLFNLDEHNLIYKINYQLEDSIVKYADNVLTTTHKAAENYIQRFNLSEHKVKTITNGYDEEDFKNIKIITDRNDKFTIFHNGIIYANRFPFSFIYAIKNLVEKKLIPREKLSIIFAYTDNDEKYKELIKNMGIDDIISFIGYLQHKDSLNLCNSSDLLLLIIGKEDKWKSVYTGKIFEYIRLCKPIISISPQNSIAESLINELNRGKNFDYDDQKGIEEYILNMFRLWEDNKLTKLNLSKEILKFERKNLTKDLCELFNNLIKKYKNYKRIVFFSIGGDKFLWDIVNQLSNEYLVAKITIKRNEDLYLVDKWMKWSDIVWLEWCDQLAVYASMLPIAKEKKLICRLHSYEAFTDNIKNINWKNIDKVIFISENLKRIVTRKVKIEENKIEVIPNGINLKKWTFKEKKKGYNIAYVGYINYKKGPMLLLHAFKSVFDKDNKYKLYIAGEFQDERYLLYFNQMIKELGIKNNVIFECWQNDLDKWLEDKNYVLCTSLLESQNLSVMQAMAKGIKPIIHNFVGAKEIYNGKYVWNTIDEAVEMILSNEYNSEEYRTFIKDNYSLERQIKKIKELILDSASNAERH